MLRLDRLGLKWMEIHLDHYENNLKLMSQHCSGAEVLPVIKADGYGHGAVELARSCERSGIRCVAVATLEEAIRLRRAFVSLDILILGAVPLSLIPDVVNYRITPTVCSLDFAEALNAFSKSLGKKTPLQLYLDTGMGRMGLPPEGVQPWIKSLLQLEHLELVGVYSHFSVSDELSEDDREYTKHQLERYVAFVESNGLSEDLMLHTANSGAVLYHPDSHGLGVVRPGLLSYGVWPSLAQAQSFRGVESKTSALEGVRAVARLCCRPLFVKRLTSGSSVGYGRAYCLGRDANIMTLPLGYADGIPRELGGKLKVTLKGKTYPVVGRICMDTMMVNLGDDSCEQDDEVLLMGEGAWSVERWAAESGRIPYEILTGLGSRWTRCYMRQGRVIDLER